MLEHHPAAPEVAIEGDEIEPVLARPGAGRGRYEIPARRPAHVSQLAGPDSLERSPEGGTPPCLDLDEGDAVTVTHDEIDLDMLKPEVPFKNRAAGKLQIKRRDTLTERTGRHTLFHRRHPLRNPPASARAPRVS